MEVAAAKRLRTTFNMSSCDDTSLELSHKHTKSKTLLESVSFYTPHFYLLHVCINATDFHVEYAFR